MILVKTCLNNFYMIILSVSKVQANRGYCNIGVIVQSEDVLDIIYFLKKNTGKLIIKLLSSKVYYLKKRKNIILVDTSLSTNKTLFYYDMQKYPQSYYRKYSFRLVS